MGTARMAPRQTWKFTTRQVTRGESYISPDRPVCRCMRICSSWRTDASSSPGRMDDPMVTDPFIFDIRKDPVLGAPVPDLLDPVRRNQSASVLLPPAQDQRVLVAGGGPVGKQDQTHATDKA